MLVFVIMTLLGCFLLAMALRLIVFGYRSTSWPTHEAEIVDTHHVIEKGDGARRQKFNHLMVIYKYIINGKEYTNTNIRYKWTRQNILVEQKKYNKVKQVKVYVNPDDYNQSVLEPGIDLSNYMAVFAGLFFITAGCLLAIFV